MFDFSWRRLANPGQPPFQNDLGPLKDDRPSDGDTPSCEIAAARAGRRGGRRDAIVLGFEITGIRSPAAGATDGTGSNEAARVSRAPRGRGCSLDSSPACGACAAEHDAGDRLSQQQFAGRRRRARARVSPRPERNRLCRGPERDNRISLGGRAKRSAAVNGRRSGSPAGKRHRRRRHSRGAGGEGGDHDHSDRVHHIGPIRSRRDLSPA